jgi:hypothetical protein
MKDKLIQKSSTQSVRLPIHFAKDRMSIETESYHDSSDKKHKESAQDRSSTYVGHQIADIIPDLDVSVEQIEIKIRSMSFTKSKIEP